MCPLSLPNTVIVIALAVVGIAKAVATAAAVMDSAAMKWVVAFRGRIRVLLVFVGFD